MPFRSPWQERMLPHLLVLACLLLPFGLFVVDAVRSYQNALTAGRREIEHTVTVFEQHAHDVLESCRLVLNLLDDNVRGQSWEELQSSASLQSHLFRLVNNHLQVGGVAMIDTAGYIRASSYRVPSPPPNFADRSYFLELRDRDTGIHIGEHAHSRIEPDGWINIVRRRTSRDGSFDGILLISVKPSTALLDFWQTQPEEKITALVLEDGRFLARFPRRAEDLTPYRVVGLAMDQMLAGSQQVYGRFVSPIDYQERMMMFRKVRGFPVILTHGAPLEIILRPWRAALLRNACLYSCPAFGLLFLAMAVVRKGRHEASALQQLENRTRELNTEIALRARAEADLESILCSIVERQENDRKRIARDLHDSIGQHVALLHLNIDEIARQTDNREYVRQKISGQKATAIEISRELSRIAWELRPVWLDNMGLEAAIRTFAGINHERSGIKFHLDFALGDRRFDSPIEATIYRAVQEAVTNIIKHAGATTIDIALEVTGGALRLIIGDNGRGFPVKILDDTRLRSSPGGGLGLQGMRERIAMVKGVLQIDSEPNGGTALTVSIPV
jgi:signal transduction histidine kinase